MVTTDTEKVLLSELEAIQDEIATVHRQQEDLERLQREAQDAEGAAMQAVDRARAVSDPLVYATREDKNQQAVYIGDASWRAAHGQAADAHGQTMAAQDRVQAASSRVIKLSKARDILEYETLPRLRAALDAKQREIDAYRQAQTQAQENVKNTDSRLAAFRKKLRGEPS